MGHITSERNGAIRTLTIDRPDALNAMTLDMWDALREHCEAAAADDSVRVVVLTGRGRGFCAGGDVKDMATGRMLEMDAEQASSMLERLMESARLLHEMPKPTVASIRGAAAGAGLSLALACDFRIMAVGAVLTTSFAGVGLSGDFGASYFLTQLVGAARARELLLCSPKLDAEAANKLGLVHSVVTDHLLEEETRSFSEKLAGGPTAAFALMKANINAVEGGADLKALFRLEARNMIRSMHTEDHAEAARAFVEKRPPRFTGR